MLKKSSQPAFKSNFFVKGLGSDWLTRNLGNLKKQPVKEIVGIDAITMIIPRTLINLKQNVVYGLETFSREFLPIIPNPFMPGWVSKKMMEAKGYKGLFANSATIKSLHKTWDDAVKTIGKNFSPDNPDEKVIRQYVRNTLENTETLVGRTWKKLKGNDLEGLSDDVAKILLNRKKLTDKEYAQSLSNAAEKYTGITKGGSKVRLNSGEGLETNIDDLLRDTVSVADQIFTKKLPKELGKTIDDLSGYIQKTTALAISSAIAVGVSIQSMITGVSRMITGKDGFSGYKDSNIPNETKAAKANQEFRQEDVEKSKESKKENLVRNKMLAVAGMGLMLLTSIGAFKKKDGLFAKGGLKKFAKNLELKGPYAHMDIVKLVYASILTGRFMAARDNTELKTSVYRDYAGFMNWLVLGAVVTKGIAHAAEKITGESFVNVSNKIKGKNFLETAKNWFNNVSFKSTSERLALDKAKTPAKKMLNAAIHNGSILGGFAYAMLALGVATPILLNKFVINKSREKQIDEGNIYTMGLDNFSQPIPFSKLSKDINENPNNELFGSFTAKMKAFSS